MNDWTKKKNGIFIQISTQVPLWRVIQSFWNVAHPSLAEGKMSLFIHVNNSWSTQTRYPFSVILFHLKNVCSRSGKHNIRECTLGFSHYPLWENSYHTQFRCFYPSPDRHVASLPYKRTERIGASQTHLQLEFVNLNINTNIILHVVFTLLMFIVSRFLEINTYTNISFLFLFVSIMVSVICNSTVIRKAYLVYICQAIHNVRNWLQNFKRANNRVPEILPDSEAQSIETKKILFRA